MSQTITAHEPYRSGRARAVAATALLAACILAALLGSVSTVIQLASGRIPDPASEEITAAEVADIGLGLLQLVVYITTIVVYCVWLFRAHKNLVALGNPKESLRHSAGWAVGSFFVPFANLVIPYRAIKEVWTKSEPDASADYYASPSPPSFFPLWWTFWLLSNFADNIATRLYLRADTQAEMVPAMWFDLIGDCLSLPAAAFAILVVRSIDQRQEERSKRVAYVGHAPPPPPLYHAPPASTPNPGGGFRP